MIEILSITFQLFIFLVIFSFPFNVDNLNYILRLKKNTVNNLDAHSLNIIFFIYICLIFSFLNIDIKLFFKIYFFISLIYLIINLKKYKTILKVENYKLIQFVVFIVVIISLFLYLAQNLKLEWDGHHWLEKVLIFYNGSTIDNLKNVSVHPEYPHLGSYIWAFFWKNSILELEYFGRLFYIYFYVTSIFLILNILKFKQENVKILLVLFFILITFDPYLFGGYQEYLIFSALIISSRFIFLIDFDNSKNIQLILLSILILYTVTWFKDEGLIYFLIFTLLLVFYQRTNNLQKTNYLLFIFSLIIIQYILQKYLVGIYDFPQKNNLTNIFSDIINLKILLTKSFKIFTFVIIAFIKYPLWLIVLLSIFLKFFFLKGKNNKINYLLICLILNLSFIFAAFFSFVGFDFMLRVSLDRLLFQTSGFYLIITLIFINNLMNTKKLS